jgi:RHS repeat-associated protein
VSAIAFQRAQFLSLKDSHSYARFPFFSLPYNAGTAPGSAAAPALELMKVNAPDFSDFASMFYGYNSGTMFYRLLTIGTITNGDFDPTSLKYETTYYTYLNGMKVGSVRMWGSPEYSASENLYLPYDGQDNVVQATNAVGEPSQAFYSYDSYGAENKYLYSGSSDCASYKGYDCDPLYRGYYGFNSSVGYYKTGARFYDTETGRFTSPDPFKGYMHDPASQNPYMYCRGNPIKYSDPSGYDDSGHLDSRWITKSDPGGEIIFTIEKGDYNKNTGGLILPVTIENRSKNTFKFYLDVKAEAIAGVSAGKTYTGTSPSEKHSGTSAEIGPNQTKTLFNFILFDTKEGRGTFFQGDIDVTATFKYCYFFTVPLNSLHIQGQFCGGGVRR